MELTQFDRQMQRLGEQFKGAYGPERVKLIWREVQTLTVEQFARIVDDLLGASRQAPMLPDFRERAAQFREQEWQRQKKISLSNVIELRASHRCSQCKDTGGLLAMSKEEPGGPFAFRCNCSFGRADRRAFPIWQVSHDFEVIS